MTAPGYAYYRIPPERRRDEAISMFGCPFCSASRGDDCHARGTDKKKDWPHQRRMELHADHYTAREWEWGEIARRARRLEDMASSWTIDSLQRALLQRLDAHPAHTFSPALLSASIALIDLSFGLGHPIPTRDGHWLRRELMRRLDAHPPSTWPPDLLRAWTVAIDLGFAESSPETDGGGHHGLRLVRGSE